MLSLRLVRRFGTATHIVAAAITCTENVNSVRERPVSNVVREPIELDEPALVKLKKERDPEKLFNLFKANARNKLVVENRFAFEDTVSRLAGAGRFDYIENLLEHQKILPQGRREGFIIRIIMLYGKAGMFKQAVNTFFDMHLYGCQRTVKAFNAALKVLTLSHDLEAIESFFREAPLECGVKLDVYSVNIVIKAVCEMGILDRAHLIMLEMEKLGIRPDVVTYTTLISAFYKFNQRHIGNGLWNLMILNGCLPNLATFNVRIQFLVNKGRSWDANKLVGLMHHLGLKPDEVTYNLLIKGFYRAGFLDMAKRIYSHLPDRGIQPNVKIYQTMIHYLCEANDFDLAYTMSKKSMEKNWFPSIDTILKLLEGLRKTGKIDKAKFVISLAKKRTPPFSAHQMNTMQSMLTRKYGNIQTETKL
ncbi:pentatricopeptide repeat-containing protein At1g80150, mitochondrial [Coffea arabica]|uniref:Pentatricopeptide repeat-containing protein At1g80150, mitochondrial n=1 Tax=Coffea arabica TaxID=13443 RepID=A0A6P6XA71_COFAR|nr:pentatricopeptide repeat-containing protein At1g80150, mitochondrial-like [Coffea arabica]XP_027124658.1 pentatricopeptide repeat-containing protein At1g80150, mitochondrial-like [Coffea arabica]XP_027124659.1 pentatricopeptide repeat-containing protein At1g80150, mitochondrial-like [Coffea arabica]XP_027124660.1 pentatricopeptide repeat-containing protein At1g80150, mitochondrial-like [Coffea arabica]XP_027124661.1 pentatricopeptide repeat-containing protein At1g80150, mitochondrial-like [C